VRAARGRDVDRDQSYVLFDIPPDRLRRMLLPVGGLRKADVRARAAALGLVTADKPDSQELCFVPTTGHKAFLHERAPDHAVPGVFTDADGREVGRHDGALGFTIGQRKGLGVAWSEPLHVVRLDGAMNRVVVAPRRDAARSDAVVGAVNWVSIAAPQEPIEVEVQVRYRSGAVAARLSPLPATAADAAAGRPHRCRLEFAEEQFSITPGQAAVFYAGDRVLGGGLIQR